MNMEMVLARRVNHRCRRGGPGGQGGPGVRSHHSTIERFDGARRTHGRCAKGDYSSEHRMRAIAREANQAQSADKVVAHGVSRGMSEVMELKPRRRGGSALEQIGMESIALKFDGRPACRPAGALA